jgi:hypothetical protein
MMGGAGGGSVDGIKERGGGAATYLYVESMVYDTGPIYTAPNKRVSRRYLVLTITQQPGRLLSGGGHIEHI